jgi:multidrug efflux pump subunit AcrB
MFTPLDPFDDRVGKPAESADALTRRLTGAFSQVQEGYALVLAPPPVRGIGSAGGFKMQVEDRSGLFTPQQLEAATDALIAEARKDPRLTSLFTTFRANVPQLYANVDRVKAKKESVASPISSRLCRFSWAAFTSTISTILAGHTR